MVNKYSPITNDDFLGSVFGQKNVDKSAFSGVGQSQTPDELNYQYYKNLVLNSAYLFKSKGTRKSIETLMRLIGAPDALVEFNEYVYLADQKINMSDFNSIMLVYREVHIKNITYFRWGVYFYYSRS
jgi:hypothetical protein